MKITVKKFGGSSIESIELINNLAAKLTKEKKQGHNIVVVVSAMAKTTDYLFSLAKQISDTPFQRELDMLVTAGERISMSLLSLALHKNGVAAISFTGSQSGIITDNCHGNARIINVNAFRIKEELQRGKIVIVAGYQGVSLNKEITTLGRGGSDTTAVALAGFLEADSCEIYKDVDGVYSADPNIVSDALKYHVVDYDFMLSLSHSGCKVIHPRAIEFAMKYHIPVKIRSTFNNKKGTIIHKEGIMEEKKLTAITCKENLLIYDAHSSRLLNILKALDTFQVDLCHLEILTIDHLRFVAKETQRAKVIELMAETENCEWSICEEISSISFIGLAAIDDVSILSAIISFLDDKGVELVNAATKPSGFTVYIKSTDTASLIKQLHQRFIIEKK